MFEVMVVKEGLLTMLCARRNRRKWDEAQK